MAVDVEVGVGVDLVADLAHPDPSDRNDAGDRLQACFGDVDHGGVDGVHQAPDDTPRRGP